MHVCVGMQTILSVIELAPCNLIPASDMESTHKGRTNAINIDHCHTRIYSAVDYHQYRTHIICCYNHVIIVWLWVTWVWASVNGLVIRLNRDTYTLTVSVDLLIESYACQPYYNKHLIIMSWFFTVFWVMLSVKTLGGHIACVA